MSSVKLPPIVRQSLDRYRRRWRVVRSFSGLFLTLFIVACIAGCVALADRLTLGLPSAARWAGLAVMLGAFAGLILWRVIRPAIQRHSDRRAAIRLGRHFPDLAEDLVTSVELTERSEEQGVSHRLTVAALEHIGLRAGAVNPRAAVPLKPLFETALAAALILGMIGAAHLLAPEAVGNALARIFQPDRQDFYSYTQVAVNPGDDVIKKGDTLDLHVSMTGRIVDQARLEVRSAAISPFEEIIPTPHGSGVWRSWPLLEDLEYRLRANDRQTGWYHVRVLPPPTLRVKSARVRMPEYAGGKETLIESLQGSLTLVAGSTLTFRFQVDDRNRNGGNDPKLACEGVLKSMGQAIPLAASADGWLESPSLTPLDKTEYSVELKDRYGLEGTGLGGFVVHVIPDALPTVRIASPSGDVTAAPSDSIPVLVSAADDIGLCELALEVRRVPPGTEPATAAPWERIPLAQGAGGKAATTLDGQHIVSLPPISAAPGDRVEYRGAASDFAGPPDKRTAYSAVRTIVIVSDAARLEQLFAKTGEVAAGIAALARRQQAAADRTGEAARRAAEGADVSTEAEAAKAEQEKMTETARALKARMDELIEQLVKNPAAPPQLAAGLDRISQATGKAADEPMTQAAENLGQAAQSGPQDQPRPMSQAQKRQEEAARRLGEQATELARAAGKDKLNALAQMADRLAAQQNDVRDLTARTAQVTAGLRIETTPKGSPEAQALDRLVQSQARVQEGADELAREIERARLGLAADSPVEAALCERAAARMSQSQIAEKLKKIGGQLARNSLFSQMNPQEEAARALSDVAATLRSDSDAPGVQAPSQDGGEDGQKPPLPPEAQALLMRLIMAEQQLVEDTALAEQIKSRAPLPHRRWAAALGQKQGDLRQDSRRLAAILAPMAPSSAALFNDLAKDMDAVRVSLQAADTGDDPTQRQQAAILQALKSFLASNSPPSAAPAPGGSPSSMMQKMMAAAHPSSTGNPMGVNDPNAQAAKTGPMTKDQWTRWRDTYMGELGVGVAESVASEYRGLVNAYFDALRKESSEP